MWEAFTIFWFFVLGCCVGSFLNVAIYRLPAGLNLSRPGSHCPRCQSPIRARHNIPLFGWLTLRGRCADCALPIPVRYPLVELTGGLLAAGLVLAEVVTAGANLPGGPWHQRGGVDWMIWSPQWDMLGIYLLHCLLLGCLLPAALIAYDGKELPRSLWALPVLVGVNCGIVWPFLLPVPAIEYPELMTLLDRQWTHTLVIQNASLRLSFGLHVTGFITAVAGALLGALLAAFLYRRLASPWSPLQRARSVVYMLPAIGAVLGWQAMVCVTAMTLTVLLFDLLLVRNQPVRALLGFSLLGSTLGLILFWKPLWNLLAPLGPNRIGLLPAGILLIVAEALLLSRLARSRPDEEPPPAVIPAPVPEETPVAESDGMEAPVSP